MEFFVVEALADDVFQGCGRVGGGEAMQFGAVESAVAERGHPARPPDGMNRDGFFKRRAGPFRNAGDLRDVLAEDAFARGLKIAAAIRKDGRLASFVKDRYSSWDSGLGAKIEAGKAGFEELESYLLSQRAAAPDQSGRQEMLENLINEFI